MAARILADYDIYGHAFVGIAGPMTGSFDNLNAVGLVGSPTEVGSHQLLNRRAWLTAGALMLGKLLTGCTDLTPSRPGREPKIPFGKAQEMLPSIHTVAELNARFGPAHGMEVFDPGDPQHSTGLNRTPRERWRDVQVFIPPTLIDTLPLGTRMIVNRFMNRAEYPAVSGTLIAYVDEQGNILGWSYSRAFTDKWLRKGAVLEALP
jgi:hypothetical protein